MNSRQRRKAAAATHNAARDERAKEHAKPKVISEERTSRGARIIALSSAMCFGMDIKN